MTRGWARYADTCDRCGDRGLHDVYQPIGWGDLSRTGGRDFYYLCRFGHTWSCGWSTADGDPTIGEDDYAESYP